MQYKSIKHFEYKSVFAKKSKTHEHTLTKDRMLPPEILLMILKNVDIKTLGSFSMVCESFRIVAEEVMKKMYEMVVGTYINMKKLETVQFNEIWEMREIRVNVNETENCLLVKNIIYYFTRYDLCLVQDSNVSEFLLSPRDNQVYLPSDGYLSYEQGYNTTFKMSFEINNFCKLTMEEEGDSKGYSRNILWTMDGCLHQIVKIGRDTDERLFHKVPEPWQDLVKMEMERGQLIANLRRTSLMMKARTGLRARNNQPRRRRELVKELMSTEKYFTEVWRDTGFMTDKIVITSSSLLRDRLLSMEPYHSLPSGSVAIKAVNIFHLNLGEGTLDNFMRMLENYLESVQGGIVLNEGDLISVSDGLVFVRAKVVACTVGPACMVESMEQVMLLD